MNITRRKFSLGALSMTLLAAVGCKVVSAVFNQSTLAALVAKVGSGLVALLTYLKLTSLVPQLQNLIQQAVNDITSWTPGTAATDVINALNDIAAFVSSTNIPILSQYATLVELAIGTIDFVISLFVQNAPASTAAIRPRAVPVVNLPSPPQKAADYSSRWNADCKALNLQTVEIK
jgi:hypothetical protein